MNARIRREYLKELQARLHEKEAAIDGLKARADRSRAELKIKYLEEVEKLKEKTAEIRAKIAGAQHEESDDAWTVFKKGINRALEDLGLQLHSTGDSMKENE